MEEDENDDRKSLCRFTINCRLLASQKFQFPDILWKMTNKTLAIFTIASYTLNTAAANYNNYYQIYGSNNNYGNGLRNFMPTKNDSEYYDSFDEFRRIYHNVTINTPIEKKVPNNNFIDKHSDSDNNDEIIANIMSNVSVSIVKSIMNAIKSNASNVINSVSFTTSQSNISGATTEFEVESTPSPIIDDQNNYWALFALILVVGTAAGNILVCLAITWERRLQNVTNYFLMSLAITDLMVAILVMPLGILSLVKGK